METLRQLQFYNRFREAVKKRTVEGMVVPLSGGLDSTLIIKALFDNGDIDKAKFVTYGYNNFVKEVEAMFNITTNIFEINVTDEDRRKVVDVLEEPFYADSVTWYLYKEINALGSRVSLSGLGADELFGGYDYYNTEHYPRGLFEPVEAKTNQEKKVQDIHFLVHHHLRENEKLGLYWEVEGRYPFLDREVAKFQDVGKTLIKHELLKVFPSSFVNRKKEGFRVDQNKDREHQKWNYTKQFMLYCGIDAK